jgi:hypothetical protein
MTTFLRVLGDTDKAAASVAASRLVRAGDSDTRIFSVTPDSFRDVPGAPFAYWVSTAVRGLFKTLSPLECGKRTAKQGLATADDFRFVRAWWEIETASHRWFLFAKGGAYSPLYADVFLAVNWEHDGAQICNFVDYETGKLKSRPQGASYYGRPALTWPLRTQSGFGMRAMAASCIFGHKGPAVFVDEDDPQSLLALLALSTSAAFCHCVELQMAFGSYEVGVIQRTPAASLTPKQEVPLAALARRAWSLKRTLDTVNETSHAFVLPAALRPRLGDYDPPAIEAELTRIQAEIDDIAFDLYGFSEADRAAASQPIAGEGEEGESDAAEDDEDAEAEAPADVQSGLLSWAVGVAFGRFDWRLATGERQAPPEPEPFDPLPAKSPGMLPDGAAPFHRHAGILVDDPGHPHDLAHLVESVLERVEMPVPSDVRRWLQRDFFSFHLQRYSKSRRKAPIYWPLATASGSYTLWVYYPSLSSQTLYTAVNDFVEPKLQQLDSETAALRSKGSGRSRAEERQLDELQTFQQELTELRDLLLKVAPGYRPSHDDGVQITAAPLWPLFRHKPWQKVLKDTSAKLERGDYDWAHLAMNYWPARVRDKCTTDKSLAIAHNLEELVVETTPTAMKAIAKRKKGTRQ